MYSVYEEYINNMLGKYPNYTRMEPVNFDATDFQNIATDNENLEKLYPDLYRLIYPMIQSACMRNTKPITKETIDDMVKDIYVNFVSDDTTILNINLTNDVRSEHASKETNVNMSKTPKNVNNLKEKEAKKEEGEKREFRPNNYVLNDLIRILLIRELIGRPGNFLPGRPGMPGNRPPLRPPMGTPFNSRDFSGYMPNRLNDRIYAAQPADFYSDFDKGFNIFEY